VSIPFVMKRFPLFCAIATYGRLFRKLTDTERFPALHAVIESGAIDTPDAPDNQFVFGLERILDGIAALINSRRVSKCDFSEKTLPPPLTPTMLRERLLVCSGTPSSDGANGSTRHIADPARPHTLQDFGSAGRLSYRHTWRPSRVSYKLPRTCGSL